MTKIIAEMSNAHNGSLDRALAIVDAVAESGADYLKMQAYTPAELVALRGDGPAPEPWGSQGWTMRDLYTKAQTPLKWFSKIVERCEAHGLKWFSSVFGPGSLAFMEAIDCPMYKLAALDYDKRALRKAVEATGKPLIRSCPNDTRPNGKATVLWCPPGYPQDYVGAPLRDMMPHGRMMRRFDGLSYHGTDPFVPALAAAYGAEWLEVHVQLDDEPSELEAHVSLTMSQLADLVRMVRTAGGLA